VKQTYALLALVGTLCLATGFLLGKSQSKAESPIIINEARQQDNMYLFEIPQGRYDVLVLKDEIWFNEFSNIINELGHFTINREQYPELFKQGVANSSFISVQLIENTKYEPKIEISNNQPDHGSYAATYRLTFNPVTKEVVIDNNGDY